MAGVRLPASHLFRTPDGRRVVQNFCPFCCGFMGVAWQRDPDPQVEMKRMRDTHQVHYVSCVKLKRKIFGQSRLAPDNSRRLFLERSNGSPEGYCQEYLREVLGMRKIPVQPKYVRTTRAGQHLWGFAKGKKESVPNAFRKEVLKPEWWTKANSEMSHIGWNAALGTDGHKKTFVLDVPQFFGRNAFTAKRTAKRKPPQQKKQGKRPQHAPEEPDPALAHPRPLPQSRYLAAIDRVRLRVPHAVIQLHVGPRTFHATGARSLSTRAAACASGEVGPNAYV